MLRFEWNALRAGDQVLVHDPRSSEMTLTTGIVASVDSRRGANVVGIRVEAQGGGGDTAVLWPSYLVVHSDPRDPNEGCWRCQELAERSAPPTGNGPPNAPAFADDDARRPQAVLSLTGTA